MRARAEAAIAILAPFATKCSQQKLCGSFAIASIATTTTGDSKPGLPWLAASPGHSFILLFSFICMSFASPSLAPWVFSGHCAHRGSVTFARTPVTYDCVVCTINMHCASRARLRVVVLRRPLYILPAFIILQLRAGSLRFSGCYVTWPSSSIN